jgi:ribosomal protein S18 acetylase RimI-like enzyme
MIGSVDDVRIRLATAEDARAIAQVHVEGWRWAYRDLMPSALLERLDVNPREQLWRSATSGEGSGWLVFVAERSEEVVGFTAAGPGRGDDLGEGTGELFGIYLVRAVAGMGVGRALMLRTMEAIGRAGFARAVLWVLEGNERARAFYEAAGWHADGAVKEDRFGEATLREVRYAIELTP